MLCRQSRRLGLRLALSSTLLLVWFETARASEAWSGKIRCAEIPGVSGALFGDFSLTVDGANISFTREVKNVTGGSSGVPERGNGTLNGTAVALQGGAALRQLSYQSTYAGKIDGAKMSLTGEQVWIGGVLQQPFHRRCRIDLTRS